MEYIIIDTNIWEFAYSETIEPEYAEINLNAKSFQNKIRNDPLVMILVNSYQICEIIEVFRKIGIPIERQQKSLILQKAGL